MDDSTTRTTQTKEQPQLRERFTRFLTTASPYAIGMATMVADGATFGQQARIRAAFGHLTGRGIYSDLRDIYAQRARDFRDAHPWISIAGIAAGTIALGGVVERGVGALLLRAGTEIRIARLGIDAALAARALSSAAVGASDANIRGGTKRDVVLGGLLGALSVGRLGGGRAASAVARGFNHGGVKGGAVAAAFAGVFAAVGFLANTLVVGSAGLVAVGALVVSAYAAQRVAGIRHECAVSNAHGFARAMLRKGRVGDTAHKVLDVALDSKAVQAFGRAAAYAGEKIGVKREFAWQSRMRFERGIELGRALRGRLGMVPVPVPVRVR